MIEMTMETGGEQKPAVTREEYDAARAVLDALPAGLYLKCFKCRRWYRNGDFNFSVGGVSCEGCS